MAGEAPRNSSRTSAKKELRLGTPEVTRAAKITAAVVGVLALAIGLWYARTAILLAFAGILLAIVLYGASRALAELTKLPRLVMLAAVVIGVALFFGVVIATAGPTLAVQIAQLARGIAAGATTLTKEVASFADQANLLQNVDLVQMLSGLLSPWGIATGATSVAFSIVGIVQRGPDRDLLRHLFRRRSADLSQLPPPGSRRRSGAAATLQMIYETGDLLRRWLIGQSISMATDRHASPMSAC